MRRAVLLVLAWIARAHAIFQAGVLEAVDTLTYGDAQRDLDRIQRKWLN